MLLLSSSVRYTVPTDIKFYRYPKKLVSLVYKHQTWIHVEGKVTLGESTQLVFGLDTENH